MTRALAALLAMAAAGAAEGAPLTADLSDHRIEITSGFTGAEVLLFGARDGAGDVVVVLSGPAAPVVVRRKARRFGVWLNRRQVRFEDAPAYYAVAANRPLAEIAPPELFAEHRVGMEYAVPSPADAAAAFRKALIRVMKRDGRYREEPRGVAFVDGRLFRSTFALPADVPPGTYRADVLLIDEGVLKARRTATLRIGKIGFGAAMFDFAHSRPLVYGLVAAVVALLAGWATDMVFRRR